MKNLSEKKKAELVGKITDLCEELTHLVQTTETIPHTVTVEKDNVSLKLFINYPNIEKNE